MDQKTAGERDTDPTESAAHTHILFKTHLMKTLPRSQIYFRHSRAELWDVSGVHPPLLLPTFLRSSPSSLLSPSHRLQCGIHMRMGLQLMK